MSIPKNPYFTPIKNRNEEHETQVAFFNFIKMFEDSHKELKYIFAVPNGGKRTEFVAKKMKAEGTKRGVPDICVPIPKNNYCGLWIEFKSSTGRQSEEQKDFQKFLEINGYAYKICRTSAEGIEELQKYLGITLALF